MYRMVPRKGFASNQHSYDVWDEKRTEDEIYRRLVCSFVNKKNAEEYVKWKNSQKKESE